MLLLPHPLPEERSHLVKSAAPVDHSVESIVGTVEATPFRLISVRSHSSKVRRYTLTIRAPTLECNCDPIAGKLLCHQLTHFYREIWCQFNIVFEDHDVRFVTPVVRGVLHCPKMSSRRTNCSKDSPHVRLSDSRGLIIVEIHGHKTSLPGDLNAPGTVRSMPGTRSKSKFISVSSFEILFQRSTSFGRFSTNMAKFFFTHSVAFKSSADEGCVVAPSAGSSHVPLFSSGWNGNSRGSGACPFCAAYICALNQLQ